MRAGRTRKGSGDEVNENEQLKNHCTVGVTPRGGGGGGAEVVQWERWNGSVGMDQRTASRFSIQSLVGSGS